MYISINTRVWWASDKCNSKLNFFAIIHMDFSNTRSLWLKTYMKFYHQGSLTFTYVFFKSDKSVYMFEIGHFNIINDLTFIDKTSTHHLLTCLVVYYNMRKYSDSHCDFEHLNVILERRRIHSLWRIANYWVYLR